MALNIKDPATDALARELARATGESITEALRTALGERLARVRRQASVGSKATDLQRYIDRGRRRELLDERSAEEILGYDEHGLPR
ncbi:MAG: type II toxin-antitoxin system VapB family antitoxin [Micropruina sp.]|uniref:type II toxin-antitoxin system VapB family antitoxin n=1 Tax=Micropruina sp. TaxID=2737536 RepID=UPI0039E6C57A